RCKCHGFHVFNVLGGVTVACRRVVACAFPRWSEDYTPVGLAYTCGRLDQRIEHRSQIERRPADDLEHLRGGGLLLQRFGQLPRALLLRLKQPRVLNCDNRLVSEGFDQLDLLVSEWPYGSPVQDEHPNWNPLMKKRHPEDCAIAAESRELTEGVFWII